jgi:SAM-dependent methyltransferase
VASDDVRRRAREHATEWLHVGNATGWFEPLYREAKGDPALVPWADLAPNPALLAWTEDPASLRGVRTAAVVGCGLGHDAERLAQRGVNDVLAFDVSPTAIEWARRLHPGSGVRYVVADLFDVPSAWRGAFDLVVEAYTLQALPVAVRGKAAAAVVDLVRPGGRMFLYARVRDDAVPMDERVAGPPWPLGRREIAAMSSGLTVDVPLAEVVDANDPSVVRAHGVWRRAT